MPTPKEGTFKQTAGFKIFPYNKKGLASELRKKKTNCPSTLIMTVENSTKKLFRKCHNQSKVLHPTVVKLLFDHNHPIHSGHSLSFRLIAQQTKDIFFDLFCSGHSAATAWHTYESKLLLTSLNKTSMQRELADRAINPSRQDVCRLYDMWRRAEMGPDDGKAMIDKLQKEIDRFNEQYSQFGGKAEMQPFQDTVDAHGSE